MNAGAQGGCTAEWLESVQVMPLDGGDCFELQREQLDFAYRHSRLQAGRPCGACPPAFRLEPGHDPKELKRVTSANLSHRTTTQPYHPTQLRQRFPQSLNR